MSIHIIKIISLSFQDVWKHRLEWFRLAYAPLWVLVFGLLLMIFSYWHAGYLVELKQVIVGNVNSHVDVNVSTPLVLLAQSFYFITHFIFAYSLYINNIRYGALHEGGKKWWTLQIDWRFFKMILYTVMLGLLMGVYGTVAAGIVIGGHYLLSSVLLDVILGSVFFIYGFYILFRISLYSVLIALDKPNPFRTSWLLLKGNVLRVMCLYFLITLALFGVTLLGALAVGGLGLILSAIGLNILLFLLWLFAFFTAQLIFYAVIAKASALVYQAVAEGRTL